MASVIDICNQALAAVGTQSTIASLEENSPEARECSRFYETVRDEVLAKALWNFARRTVALALLKERSTAANWSSIEPASPWTYSYAYPSDCLRVRYIFPAGQPGVNPANPGYYPPGSGVYEGLWASPWIPRHAGYDSYFCNHPPYRFEVTSDADENGNDTRVIATDLEDALLIYTRRVDNVNLWDPLFNQALIYTLAARLAIPLSGDSNMLKNNLQLAQAALDEARETNANEAITMIPQSDPDWICIRG